jgi:hypothetical protein
MCIKSNFFASVAELIAQPNRTGSMIDIGSFPVKWLHGVEGTIEIYPWFPLSPNLISQGEAWIPEVQLNATVCFTVSIRTDQICERNKDCDKICLVKIMFF